MRIQQSLTVGICNVLLLLVLLEHSNAIIYRPPVGCKNLKGQLYQDCIQKAKTTVKDLLSLGFLNKRQRGKGVEIGALDHSLCGQPSVTPLQERIVGGVEAAPHSWPWMASIRVDGVNICGGSLLDHQWVMTAAHCGQKMKGEVKVVLGSHSLHLWVPGEVELDVELKIPHENFKKHPVNENDVMLIKLQKPVQYSDGIAPVCLPAAQEEFTPKDQCVVTGWGRLEDDGAVADTLRQVDAPIITNHLCNQPNWYRDFISDNMLCAGYEHGGKDACARDSGGPLLCQKEGLWRMAGVVSWGFGCGEARQPGVYAKTSRYVTWIRDTIHEN